jgi:hypothetical protein
MYFEIRKRKLKKRKKNLTNPNRIGPPGPNKEAAAPASPKPSQPLSSSSQPPPPPDLSLSSLLSFLLTAAMEDADRSTGAEPPQPYTRRPGASRPCVEPRPFRARGRAPLLQPTEPRAARDRPATAPAEAADESR